MKKITTSHKYINPDVIDIYTEKLGQKQNNLLTRKINDNLIVWSKDGRGKLASLSKINGEVIFETF